MRSLRLLVALLVLFPGYQLINAQSLDSRVTITGRVQFQGKPISDALVTLWEEPFGEPTERTTVAKARTDNAGNYELANVTTGNYLIEVSAIGFVTGKENDMLAKLRHVTVVGGQGVGPFNFELVREGVIAGIVTDAAGKPLANIPVTLKAEALPDGAGPPKYAENVRTDDQGRYRIAGMPGGKYRIAAGHYPLVNGTFQGRPAYRRIFYPNTIEETEATTIEIRPGSDVSDINFNLGQPVKTFKVRLNVVDDRTGKPVPGLDYSLRAYSNGKPAGGAGGASRSNEQGEVILQNIPLGEYMISIPNSRALSSKNDPQTPNYFGESPHFQVTDKDLNIEVRVTKAASVAGHVVIEGPAGQDVIARMPEMELMGFVETNPVTPAPMVRATIRPDGSFLFTGLRAGKLKLNFYPPATGKPLPLNLVRTEQDGLRLDGDLNVQLGDELTGVKLVMAYAAGSVHGLVELDDGSIPQGLIGMASVWQGNKFAGERSVVNQNGEFILQNLVAGEYKLVVVAHDAIGRPWHVEQQVKVFDDKITEAKMALDSKVKPNPAATSKSYLIVQP